MRRSFLNKSDGDLLEAIAAIIKMCLAHLLEYKIDKKAVEKLQGLYKKANSTYTINKDPLTRNTLTTRAKNAAIKEMKAFASKFITTLVLNENIPNEVLTTLGIRSRYRHRGGAAPAPERKGVVHLKKHGVKYRVSLNLPTDNQTLKSSIDKNATGGTEWEYKIGETGETLSLPSRKSSVLISVREEDKGKILRVRGRWVNAKFEPGPWSDWVEIVIS